METEVEVKEYKTRDMNLAASLMVDGIRYIKVEIDADDSRRKIFVFEQNSEIERITSQRANGTHIASTVHYDECLRRLKSIIHSL